MKVITGGNPPMAVARTSGAAEVKQHREAGTGLRQPLVTHVQAHPIVAETFRSGPYSGAGAQ
jgi:hypothetical protein